MLHCSSCETPNTLDSRYCKGCGHVLPESEKEEHRRDIAALVAQGFELLTEGRSDEATRIARQTLQEDPSNASAYALLGDALERDGDLPGALEAYERATEIDPDSRLDRVRLAHLRSLIVAPATPVRTRKPLLAAISATLAVASLGTAGILYSNSLKNRDSDQGLNRGVQSNEMQARMLNPENEPAADDAIVVNQNANAPQTPESNPNKPTPDRPIPGNAEPERTTAANAQGNQRPMPRPGGTLPNPANGDSGFTPVVINPDPSLIQRPPAGGSNTAVTPQRPGGVDEDPKPIRDEKPKPGPSTKPSTDPNPKPRPGVIEITPTPGGPKRAGGSVVVDRANEAETLVRVARQHFLSGNMEQAADAYEKAIRAGAGSGQNYQRLGQAYERLGRRVDAITAYERAASIYRRGGTPESEAAAKACQQAIDLLRG